MLLLNEDSLLFKFIVKFSAQSWWPTINLLHFNCFDSGWSAEHLNYVTTINNCVNLRKMKKWPSMLKALLMLFSWKIIMNEKCITKQNNKVIFNLLLAQHNPETNLTSILTFDFIISSHQLDISWWL